MDRVTARELAIGLQAAFENLNAVAHLLPTAKQEAFEKKNGRLLRARLALDEWAARQD